MSSAEKPPFLLVEGCPADNDLGMGIAVIKHKFILFFLNVNS